jgi:phospholipid/cholesterol/gamma-HCH transport system substrate-binding protein
MKSRLEWKVGLFVLIGLVLVAVLMLGFSKGLTFFQPTYTIRLVTTDVGGLKVRSAVLMSGVQVGTVSDISLAQDGKSVTLSLKIYRRFVIHKDAKFVIEQSGFLGDQYVGISPTKNAGEVYQNGDRAQAEEPFNFTETARTAGGLVARVDETAVRLNAMIDDIRRLLLNEQTLTNLALTTEHLHTISSNAKQTVDGANSAVQKVNALLEDNTPTITTAATNLLAFSEDLKEVSAGLNTLLATNTPAINTAVSNIATSTASLQEIVTDMRDGKGAAGKLLRDEQLSESLSQIAGNLSITTSNLNRLGLWGILWQKKPRKSSPPPQPLSSPKQSRSAR